MSPYFSHRFSPAPPESHLWRRVHRPEEYAVDAARWVARELRLPPALLMPTVPLARRMATSWEDAAVETTQYDVFPCGRRRLRTVFQIANYSSRAIYQLCERMLKSLGIGRKLLRDTDTEFAWILLGGVLNDYAGRAGLGPATTEKLLSFRLRNSDYFTMTTWFPNCVEIANLETRRIERLPLPPAEIEKIVAYAVKLQKSLLGKKCREVHPHTPESREFREFMDVYDSLS